MTNHDTKRHKKNWVKVSQSCHWWKNLKGYMIYSSGEMFVENYNILGHCINAEFINTR